MRDMYKPTFLLREERARSERASDGSGRRHARERGLEQMPSGIGYLETAAGEAVFTQRRVIDRLRDERGMTDLVKEAAARISAPIAHDGKRSRSLVTVDLGREIGVDECVATPAIDLDDRAEFILIPRHHEPVRVVADRDPTPCSTLTMVLERGGRGFQLIAAWIGRQTPSQPHDIRFKAPYEEALEEIAFWCSHALVAKPEWGRPWRSTWRRVIDEAIENS